MNSATLNIVIALSMVAFPVALIVWFIKYMASESEKRMTHMMERVGLDLVPASLDDQRIKKAIADVKARCRRCPSEGLCERWLLGKVDGENTFCPNALTFDRLMQTAKSAA